MEGVRNFEGVKIERNEADEKMGRKFAGAAESCFVEKDSYGGIKIFTERETDLGVREAWVDYLHQIGLAYGFPYKSLEEIIRWEQEDVERKKSEAIQELENPGSGLDSYWKKFVDRLSALVTDKDSVLNGFNPSLLVRADNYNEFHLERIAKAKNITHVEYTDLAATEPYNEFLIRRGFKKYGSINSRCLMDYNNTNYLTPEERAMVADLLGQEYKFHLMPAAYDVPFLLKTIHALIDGHPRFGKLIHAFKFANFQLYRKIIEQAKQKQEEDDSGSPYFYQKFGGGDRIGPFFVLYPYYGYDVAQELADILLAETGGITPAGLEPQMNDKLNDLIFVANGSGYDKYNYLRLQAGYSSDKDEFKECVSRGGLLDPENLAYAKGAKHIWVR